MTEKQLPRGIADFLIKVSQHLPEPLPAPDKGQGSFVGGSGKPPVIVAGGLMDGDKEFDAEAQKLGKRFTEHWTTVLPITAMEERDIEISRRKSPGQRLEAALIGRTGLADELIRDYEHEMGEILSHSLISDPAKLFLSIVASEMIISDRAPAEVIDFEKIGTEPTMMFSRAPEHTKAVDRALYTFHGKILELAEQQMTNPSPDQPEQIDSYWTIDSQFIEEQKELHAEWNQALAA